MSEAAAIGQKPWVRTVVTTAGDVEREAKSRVYNAVEGIGIYLLVMVTLWPFCYLFGKVYGNEFVLRAANVPLILGAVYLLFVSPIIHKDTAESWGLGNPRKLWQLLNEAPVWKRSLILLSMVTVMIVLNTANWIMWPEVAKFVGFKNTQVTEFNDPAKHPFGIFFIIPFGLIVSTFLVTCVIRYDNFGSAFKTALKISLPLVGMIFLGAYAASGSAAFSGFDPVKYALGVFGYVFWGAVQQLLFSSYFGTRMRKGFGPSYSPNNVVRKEDRLRMALQIGALISAVLVPLGYGTLLALYGVEKAPPSLILWLLGFTLPLGTAWGYFYAMDKKRMLVATLCGSFFGLIHIDSYGLVAVTFLLGVMLVWAFMEDKNRNLVALGFVHGLLGSTFGWLFDKGQKDGALHVDYSVGPWNIKGDDITAYVLVFPMLSIAVYLLLARWSIQNIQEDHQQG